MDMPEGVTQNQDGYYYNALAMGKRVCEDCWRVIPRYVDFPLGLVSPESDDPRGNAGKYRMIEMSATEYSRQVREPLRKAVCLDCYHLAFERVYPGAKHPELSRMVSDTTTYLEPEPVSAMGYAPDPMQS